MKQDIAVELSSRLRSGAYIQGQGALKTMDTEGNVRNCCLGVVCEMAVEAGVIPREQISHVDEVTFYRFGEGFDNNFSTLPEVVREWAGMYSDNGSFESNTGAEEEMGNMYCLSGFNDTDFNFLQIADIVDRYYEDL